jgi:hypothetical protein
MVRKQSFVTSDCRLLDSNCTVHLNFPLPLSNIITSEKRCDTLHNATVKSSNPQTPTANSHKTLKAVNLTLHPIFIYTRLALLDISCLSSSSSSRSLTSLSRFSSSCSSPPARIPSSSSSPSSSLSSSSSSTCVISSM